MTGVLQSAQWIQRQSVNVHIDDGAIDAYVQSIADPAALCSPHTFDSVLHFVGEDEPTCQYLLVVDALNFCFWPAPGLEYEHLAGGVKRALLADVNALDSGRLASIDGAGVQLLFGWPEAVPQQEERAALLREVGSGLLKSFGGKACNLVAAAAGSAVRLVQLLAMHFSGFRDHAVYRGRQVFFYKRAQIFVGDVYGAFGGKGLGAFTDIGQLTMFADYRVPVVLKVLGILSYSDALESCIQDQREVPAGSDPECEIRAATIVAVEHIRQRLAERLQKSGSLSSDPADVLAIHIDWQLWEAGERSRAVHPPHHRTRTIYY